MMVQFWNRKVSRKRLSIFINLVGSYMGIPHKMFGRCKKNHSTQEFFRKLLCLISLHRNVYTPCTVTMCQQFNYLPHIVFRYVDQAAPRKQSQESSYHISCRHSWLI